MRALLRRKSGQPTTASIFYASDVHGAEPCWRKFLGAGRFYGVTSLIMGGDITGKGMVPIEVDGASFRATFLGEVHEGDTEEGLQELVTAIRFHGLYPWPAERAEVERVRADQPARDQMFDQVINAELKRWLDLADERMEPAGVDVYVMSGNDDPWSCDATIESASWVQPCDGRVVRVGEHEMISCSYANRTPWNSPRELDENDLYELIKKLADQLEEPGRSIFNLHAPPFDSGLDTAAQLREDLTVVYEGGVPKEVPVGSTAVRQLIEEYQPLLALHGHIHESRGETTIGRTLAVNTGSEYTTGMVHGGVIKLHDNRVVHHQLVVG